MEEPCVAMEADADAAVMRSFFSRPSMVIMSPSQFWGAIDESARIYIHTCKYKKGTQKFEPKVSRVLASKP